MKDDFTAKGKSLMKDVRQHALSMLIALLFLIIAVSIFFIVRQSMMVTDAYMITNVPQAVFYAEQFNVQQKRYKIHCIYEKNLEKIQQTNTRKKFPALIFGNHIFSEKVLPQLDDISYLFATLSISRRDFYESLLQSGLIQNRQLLLPVSFNIPLVIMPKNFDSAAMEPGAALEPGVITQIQDLRVQSNSFIKKQKNEYTAIGFHPLWSDEAMYYLFKAFNSNFRVQKDLQWDQNNFNTALKYLKSWFDTDIITVPAVLDFKQKYEQIPPDLQLSLKKTQAWVISSKTYLLLDESRRSALKYSWLAHNNSIPVDDDAVFLGILSNGKSKDVAEAFIKWFYQYETQKKLMELNKLFRLDEIDFGIANGFSALIDVTEKVFPLYYKELLGKLPPKLMISTINVLPDNWQVFYKKFILPLVYEWLSAEEIFNINERIAQEYSKWKELNQ